MLTFITDYNAFQHVDKANVSKLLQTDSREPHFQHMTDINVEKQVNGYDGRERRGEMCERHSLVVLMDHPRWHRFEYNTACKNL
jgi:hypothetical protein